MFASSLRLVLVATLGLCGGVACMPGKTAANHAMLRQPAPMLDLKLRDGSTFSLAAANGKVIVLDYWATWCGPCKESFPHLEVLYKKYSTSGVKFVAINEDDDGKDAAIGAFLKETGATFPIATDGGGVAATSFRVESMPTTFVIDRRGVVRFAHPGFHGGDAEALDAEVRELLAEK